MCAVVVWGSGVVQAADLGREWGPGAHAGQAGGPVSQHPRGRLRLQPRQTGSRRTARLGRFWSSHSFASPHGWKQVCRKNLANQCCRILAKCLRITQRCLIRCPSGTKRTETSKTQLFLVVS